MPKKRLDLVLILRFLTCRWKQLCSIGVCVLLCIILGEAWLGEYFSTQARSDLMLLPSYDYEQEGRSLYDRNLYDDALLVIDAGLEDTFLKSEAQEELRVLREQVVTDKDGWIRRIKNVGYGALTGKADTVEGTAVPKQLEQ